MNFQPPPSSFGPPVGSPAPASTPEPDDAGKGAQKKPTRKLISAQMRLALVFCVVAAILGGYFLFFASAPGTYVVVAKEPLAAGTVIDSERMFEAIPVDDEAVQVTAMRGDSAEEALTQAEDVNGLHVSYPISGKQQIGKNLFNVEMTIEGELKGNERLVSIRASVSNAVAGAIVPGDKVDIIGSADEISGLVLSDVPVVAVTVSESKYEAAADQQTGEDRDARAAELLPANPVPGIYVVRIPEEDVQKLVAVNNGGELSLVYRPKSAKSDSSTAGPLSATDVICGDSDCS